MNWTKTQRAYHQILADPEEERDRHQIAKDLGVELEKLHLWETKDGFWLEVNKYDKSNAERALASVWSALSARARNGEIPAIKLLFSLLGLTSEAEAVSQQPIQFKLVVENGNGSTTITANGLQLEPANQGDKN